MIMQTSLHLRQTDFQQQRGATLIVGLIMLFLLTIIGMASMNITTVDVKVTANAKDRQLAFIGAESAMFQAGQEIANHPDMLDNNVPGYVHTQYKAAGVSWWSDYSNWSLSAVTGTPISSDFKIEFPETVKMGNDLTVSNTGPGNFLGYFPTTTRATGPGQANVILQSYYQKKLDIKPLE
jgi:type IV pilus assembly protein PilX